jgi:hypothetical protein
MFMAHDCTVISFGVYGVTSDLLSPVFMVVVSIDGYVVSGSFVQRKRFFRHCS